MKTIHRNPQKRLLETNDEVLKSQHRKKLKIIKTLPKKRHIGHQFFSDPTPRDALKDSWLCNQFLFKTRIKNAIDQGLVFLTKNLSHRPMLRLYEFLAQIRQEIALELTPDGDELSLAADFGCLRSKQKRDKFNPGVTFIPKAGRYADMYCALLAKLQALEFGRSGCIRVVSFGRSNDLYLMDATVVEKDGIILSSLGYLNNFSSTTLLFEGKREACLTKSKDKANYLKKRKRLQSITPAEPTMIIIHPSPELIDKIFSRVDLIYADMRARQCNKEEEIQKIADIIWWLAQAMPCGRGSACIVEMMVEVLFQQRKITFKPYECSSKITLDLKAIFEPNCNKFTEDFKRSFGLLEESRLQLCK